VPGWGQWQEGPGEGMQHPPASSYPWSSPCGASPGAITTRLVTPAGRLVTTAQGCGDGDISTRSSDVSLLQMPG